MRNKFLAEFTGTFALVFAGCGSVMIVERFPGSIDPHAIPVIFGLVVAVMIYAVGHISGAHFNPAVTLAFGVARHFPLKEVLPYWLAQVLGALSAMLLLKGALPHGEIYGVTELHLPVSSGFLWEAVMTFFLMFVIIAVATDTRAVGTMAGIAIGGTVALDAYIGGSLTGASMNPARSLAPALISGNSQNLWVYLLAPPVGACLAAVFYEQIRCQPHEREGCC